MDSSTLITLSYAYSTRRGSKVPEVILLLVVWHSYTLTGVVSFEVVPSSSCRTKPGGAAADGNIYGTPLAELPSVLSRFREHLRCPETFVPSR